MSNYRGYILKQNPFSPTLINVVTEGRGGKIPRVLEGSFTSHHIVKNLIDNYLDGKKEKVNASKANPESAG